MKNKIVLFIPMYNCEKQITRVLAQLTPDICCHIAQVIIVNNISTDDGEQAVIDYLKEHSLACPVNLLRNNQNYGLGGSHKVAFQYATSHNFDYIIVLHGDDQGSIHDLKNILDCNIYEKYDCCLGARFMKGSQLKGYSKFRTFGNRVYNILFQIATGTKIKDMGSGLNMYKTKMLENQFYLKYHDGLMFNCYMLLANGYNKFNTYYFPISWREDDQVSNVKLVNQAIRTFWIAFSYFISKKNIFMQKEFRDEVIHEYGYQEIYTKE